MPKTRDNWNIAFEISPLLTASGSFGDKSGVFRYMYGLLLALINELKHRDPTVKILLFTFAPHNLNYAIFPELLKLADDPNITIVSYHKNINITVPRYNIIFDILEIRPLKKILKLVDNIFSLRKISDEFNNKRQFKAYVKFLETEFSKHKIKAVFHSETGFFPLHGFINIITIYDLTPIIFPELHRRATVELHLRKIKFARNRAQIVLAISESTKRDLLAHSPNFCNKPIIVAYPGLDGNFANNKESVALGNPALHSKKYLLYYGTFEPRKNIAYTVRAFTELYLSGGIPSDFRLLLIGGNGWGKTKENILGYIIEQFPIQAKSPIIVLDYATDLQLKSYIEHARAVLYPSFYEGFGLPVLESMSLGTPVLTSNTSSLPEVGGDAALYANPKDYFDLKNKIKLLVDDDKLTDEMSKKGLRQSRKFTWENTVDKILTAIKIANY